MNKIFKNLLILLFSVSFASTASWAYTEIPKEPKTRDDSGDSRSGDEDIEAAKKSVRDAAINARDRATAISIGAAGTAAYFGYKCATGNLGACAIATIALSGAISTAQYASDKQLEIVIRDTEDNPPDVGSGGTGYCTSVDNCDDGGGGDGRDGREPTPIDTSRKNNETKKLLKEAGYGVDSNGNIQTPKGTFAPSQLSPSTLASLGVTPELQAEFRTKMQEEIARARAQGSDSMTAGSGSSGPATVLRAQRDSSGWSQAATSTQRGLASVDGLSVRRGDDLIGIQSADIFEMVHQKYQKLRKQTNFLE